MSDETTYTGAQLTAALDATERHIYQAAGDNGVDDVFRPLRDELDPINPTRQYTLAEFSGMLNNAADRIEDEIDYENDDTIWEQSVRNLAVNSAGHLLEHPDASLDDIITTAWADLDDIDWPEEYDDTPEEQLPAQGTPERDKAIVATVLGWVS